MHVSLKLVHSSTIVNKAMPKWVDPYLICAINRKCIDRALHPDEIMNVTSDRHNQCVNEGNTRAGIYHNITGKILAVI